MKSMNWVTVASVLLLGAVLVGGWLAVLGSMSLAEITRNSLVIIHPTEGLIVLTTFAMLAGVAILSIQIGSVVERIIKK